MKDKEVVIGHVCYKGNHIALDGESDYGCCGSHYYAEIKLNVNVLYPNPRGEETVSAESVAKEIAEIVSRHETFQWESYDASTDHE